MAVKLRLPRLSAVQASWGQLQLWWQELVTKVEARLDAQAATLAQHTSQLSALGYNGATGWGAYIHTGSAQALTANVEAALSNNKGTTLESQIPSDVTTFYDGTKIIGRVGDALHISQEFTFTPSSALASWLDVSIDLGGAIGKIFPARYPLTAGSGVAHKLSYNVGVYQLDTWAANGGTIKVMCDGPGSITAARLVITRTHKART